MSPTQSSQRDRISTTIKEPMGSSRFGDAAPKLGGALPQHCEIVRDGFGRVSVGGQN
jgi:hypothetical protein